MRICIFVFLLVIACNVRAMDAAGKALHALNRFTYGPRSGEVEKMAAGGAPALQKWFESQLVASDPTRDSDVSAKLKALPSLKMTTMQLLQKYPKGKDIEMRGIERDTVDGTPKDILKELVIQKLVRAAESENQFEEVLVDFWFNHFNVNFDKGQVRHTLTSYERDIIRPHVFGNFKELLTAVAASPAMMIYLDNTGSKNGKINENYARELFELHTLGVDGGYTQRDIQEAARVLTGWGVEKPKEVADFKFFKNQHDMGEKFVLGVKYNGKKSTAEGENLLAFLAAQKNTAKFIARKLAVKFISDSPSEKTVDEIARAFIESKGDLKTVYRAVFRAEELWSDSNVGAKIKTPLEFVISSVRAIGASVLPQPERINQLKGFFAQSGQELYRCVPPTGYKATADNWVNPGAMVNRINFAMSMVRDQIPQIEFEKEKLISPIKNNKYKNQIDLLIYFNKNVFNSIVKMETLNKINDLLNDSQNYQEDGTRELPLHYYPLDKMLALLISTPEFQRR